MHVMTICRVFSNPVTYNHTRVLLSYASHSPVVSIGSKLVPPCSEHVNALSGRGGWGKGCKNLLLFCCTQTQVRGQISPLCYGPTQLDQVGIGTGAIKELSGELGQLLLKAVNRSGRHTAYRYTASFSHGSHPYKRRLYMS